MEHSLFQVLILSGSEVHFCIIDAIILYYYLNNATIQHLVLAMLAISDPRPSIAQPYPGLRIIKKCGRQAPEFEECVLCKAQPH